MDDKFKLIVLITVLAIIAILLIWCIYTSIIFSNNKLYCKHYCKEEWNLWEKVIEKLKEQRGTIYVSKHDDNPTLDSFHINIEIGLEEYELIYWAKRGTTSVHQGMKCILCGYDKYHSNMAVGIMREKIKKKLNNTGEGTKRIIEEMIGEQ